MRSARRYLQWLFALAFIGLLMLLAIHCIDIYLDAHNAETDVMLAMYRPEDLRQRIHALYLPCMVLISISRDSSVTVAPRLA